MSLLLLRVENMIGYEYFQIPKMIDAWKLTNTTEKPKQILKF